MTKKRKEHSGELYLHYGDMTLGSIVRYVRSGPSMAGLFHGISKEIGSEKENQEKPVTEGAQ